MTELAVWQIDEVTKVGKNWALVPLNEVIAPVDRPEVPIPGVIYRQVGVKWWGLGVYEREAIDGSRTQYKTLSRIEVDDIIINKIWARHGSVSLVPQNLAGCYASTEFPLFVPNKERLHPQWFHWLTKTRQFWTQCDEKSRGTSGKNRIRPEQFLKIQIPLPPLDEQRRIVARIDTLAARIEEAYGLRREAAEEAEKLSKGLLTQALEDNNQGEKLLEEICTQITDGEHATPPRVDQHFIPLATAKNIRDGYLDLSTTDFVTPETAQKCWQRCKPKHDDVLMVCVGATTGRVCLLKNPPDMVIVRSVALIRPDLTKVNSEYLSYLLKSTHVQGQVWGRVRQSAQPGIYLNQISKIRISLPSLDEQRRIVAYLDELQAKADALKHLQAQTAAELEALLPAVLDQAFRGEL
jgi:type I restriction enzyme S subunit